MKVRNDEDDYGMAGKQVSFEFNSWEVYDNKVCDLYDKFKQNINI